jgi:hypothetical protein
MNPNLSSRGSTAKRRTRAVTALAGLATLALLTTTGCSGNVVHNYRTFQSALDRGASCSELHDQRARFDDEDTLTKIDRDLDRIGCTSPDATRND